MMLRTAFGVRCGWAEIIDAAIPETYGQDMDVPECAMYVLPVAASSDMMSTPGATRSGLWRPMSVGPRLEKDGIAPL